jgi:DNA-directed RNA polymerase subunit RPC12/RpoP
MLVGSGLIQCHGCEWKVEVHRSMSVYEEQQLEQVACPHCGGHTLSYRPTQLNRRMQLADKRRKRYQLVAQSR